MTQIIPKCTTYWQLYREMCDASFARRMATNGGYEAARMTYDVAVAALSNHAGTCEQCKASIKQLSELQKAQEENYEKRA